MSDGSYTGIIRVIPAFLAGVFLGMNIPFAFFLPATLLLISFILLISFSLFVNPKKQYAFRWFPGSIIQAAVFVSGVLITHLDSEIVLKNHFSKIEFADSFVCVPNEEPIRKGANLRFEAEVRMLKVAGIWKETSGKCLVYIKSDSISSAPNYGDKLLFLKQPARVKSPMNPGTFNFQAWLENRQIYHQVFLKHDEFICVEKDQGNYLMSTAIRWRKQLLRSISNAGIHDQEKAVLSALILGQDDEIDPELRNNYSTAGVMHILAVSGMHVGLIYAALCALLKFPGSRRGLRLFKAGVLLACLWFYAMLTGLSPSVLRASMMLSFIVVGISLERAANPLNILAASALCLFLIFSPALILSVGFQLSYLAVAGILFLYKPLHSIYVPKSWLSSQVWSILSVSVVAQLATFPLSIYYFHRFPNYFLLSNLVVIPIGTIVIFGGISVLIFSWWNDLSLLLGYVISALTRFLNECVSFLGSLPASSTDELYIPVFSMLLLYMAIVFISLYLAKIRVRYLMIFFLIMMIYYSLQLKEKYRAIQQNFGIIYHSPRYSFFQFVQGTHIVSVADDSIVLDEAKRLRLSEGFKLEKRIESEKIIKLSDESSEEKYGGLHIRLPFIEFNKKKIFVLNPDHRNRKPADSLDYILITANPKLKPQEWLDGINCETIIADLSNPPWTIKSWKEECKKRGIHFIDISTSGAYIFPD
jgi:competence protein ComEC